MALHEAVRLGDVKKVKDLIRLGVHVNAVDEEHCGETPLHCACSRGNPLLARLLIKSGARISLTDNNAHTPVQRACEEGRNLELLQMLRKRVDDVGVLLYWSIKGGWPEGTEYLLSDSATVDQGRFKDLVRLKHTPERAQCIQQLHSAMQPLPFALSKNQQQRLDTFLKSGEEPAPKLRRSGRGEPKGEDSEQPAESEDLVMDEADSPAGELLKTDLKSISFSELRRLCSQLGLPQGSHPTKEELLLLLQEKQKTLQAPSTSPAKLSQSPDKNSALSLSPRFTAQVAMSAPAENLTFGELRSLASNLNLPQGSNPTRASLTKLVQEAQRAGGVTPPPGEEVGDSKQSAGTKRKRITRDNGSPEPLRPKRARTSPRIASQPRSLSRPIPPQESLASEQPPTEGSERTVVQVEKATQDEILREKQQRDLRERQLQVQQQQQRQQQQQQLHQQRLHQQRLLQEQRQQQLLLQQQQQQQQLRAIREAENTERVKNSGNIMPSTGTHVAISSRSYQTIASAAKGQGSAKISARPEATRNPRPILQVASNGYVDSQALLNEFQHKYTTSQQRAMELEQRLNDLKLSLELERTSKERALQRERQLTTDVETMQQLLTDTRGSLNEFRLQWYTEKEAYRVTIDSELKEIEEKRKLLARQESQLDPWMSVMDEGLLEPISIVSQQKQKLEKQKSRIADLKRQLNDEILLWEIEKKELSFGSIKVASSPPGVILQGFWKRTPVALHSISHPKATQSMRSLFKREISTLRRLRHPNLIVCYGVCSEDESLTVVTELCGRSTLKAVLCEANRAQLTAARCLNLALQIAKALQFLHEAGVVHNYLMPEHCILTDHWVVKVRGFGIAGVLDVVSPKDVLQCYAYNAPEVFEALPDLLLRRKEMRKKRDVFSFGVILAQIFTQQQPWKDLSQQAVAQKVLRGERAFSALPGHVPSCIRSLVTSCWDHEPEKRPSFDQVVHLLQECTA